MKMGQTCGPGQAGRTDTKKHQTAGQFREEDSAEADSLLSFVLGQMPWQVLRLQSAKGTLGWPFWANRFWTCHGGEI